MIGVLIIRLRIDIYCCFRNSFGVILNGTVGLARLDQDDFVLQERTQGIDGNGIFPLLEDVRKPINIGVIVRYVITIASRVPSGFVNPSYV